jgi:hypothetical protein
MKITSIVFALLWLLTFTHPVDAQPHIREVYKGLSQIDFGHHLLNVYFNVEPATKGFENNTAGFKHTDETRRQYVSWLAEEIQQLPERFVTRYMVDNIFFLAIIGGDQTGFHAADLIVIEGRKPLNDRRRIFYHETGHEIWRKNEHNPRFQHLVNILEQNRIREYAEYMPLPRLYEAGHSTTYANSNAAEGFCELFADLMVHHETHPLADYIRTWPGSMIGRKCRAIMAFLDEDLKGEGFDWDRKRTEDFTIATRTTY